MTEKTVFCFLDLIDEITDNVDRTDQKLIRTEGHVKKVTKKSGSCGKYGFLDILPPIVNS